MQSPGQNSSEGNRKPKPAPAGLLSFAKLWPRVVKQQLQNLTTLWLHYIEKCSNIIKMQTLNSQFSRWATPMEPTTTGAFDWCNPTRKLCTDGARDSEKAASGENSEEWVAEVFWKASTALAASAQTAQMASPSLQSLQSPQWLARRWVKSGPKCSSWSSPTHASRRPSSCRKANIFELPLIVRVASPSSFSFWPVPSLCGLGYRLTVNILWHILAKLSSWWWASWNSNTHTTEISNYAPLQCLWHTYIYIYIISYIYIYIYLLYILFYIILYHIYVLHYIIDYIIFFILCYIVL